MTPQPTMTTREAWRELAKMWRNAEVCDCGCGRMTVGPRVSGLCSTISIMTFRKMITENQEKEMLACLPRPRVTYFPGVRPFLWPTDAVGAKERAEFCLAQSKLAKGKSSEY